MNSNTPGLIENIVRIDGDVVDRFQVVLVGILITDIRRDTTGEAVIVTVTDIVDHAVVMIAVKNIDIIRPRRLHLPRLTVITLELVVVLVVDGVLLDRFLARLDQLIMNLFLNSVKVTPKLAQAPVGQQPQHNQVFHLLRTLHKQRLRVLQRQLLHQNSTHLTC